MVELFASKYLCLATGLCAFVVECFLYGRLQLSPTVQCRRLATSGDEARSVRSGGMTKDLQFMLLWHFILGGKCMTRCYNWRVKPVPVVYWWLLKAFVTNLCQCFSWCCICCLCTVVAMKGAKVNSYTQPALTSPFCTMHCYAAGEWA